MRVVEVRLEFGIYIEEISVVGIRGGAIIDDFRNRVGDRSSIDFILNKRLYRVWSSRVLLIRVFKGLLWFL